MSNTNDPWVVQAPKQVEQVPIGFHIGDFLGITDVDIKGEPKWRFAWTIKTGVHAGKIASALTDRKINANTLPGRLIAGLIGGELKVGESVKAAVEACRGKTYIVNVAVGPQGGKPGVKSVATPPPST